MFKTGAEIKSIVAVKEYRSTVGGNVEGNGANQEYQHGRRLKHICKYLGQG